MKFQTRLAAIQVIFQSLVNKKKIFKIKEEFDQHYRNQTIDQNGKKIKYNVNFLTKLIDLYILTSSKYNFSENVNKHIDFDRSFLKWDLINQSIMMMTISEIIYTEKNKRKIIINEYIELSKLFVNLKDVKIINAILDKLINEKIYEK